MLKLVHTRARRDRNGREPAMSKVSMSVTFLSVVTVEMYMAFYAD